MAKVRCILLALVTLLGFCSCERDGMDLAFSVGPFGESPEATRKVMLLYEAGFNSLGGYMTTNISDLQQGYLPGKGRDEDILLLFSHLTKSSRNYTSETAPAMIRLYTDRGKVISDTLKVWPVGTSVANGAMVTEVFNWVKENFPAAGYGAIMSSHATGWLPEGYFSNPKPYEGNDRSIPYSWSPRMRTFGQEYYSSGSKIEEIEIKDLAAAIPYKLDYILFDACLMATVEVAWELRNVCSYLAVSPCEIPAAGFNYKTLAGHLLQPEVPDLKAVCMDYFAAYEKDTMYGATISMIDCGALEPLAAACNTLFDRYRSGILNLDGRNVQVYDRTMSGKHYYIFFDLKDMLREAGATEDDLAFLQKALDQALVYEAHTARFIDVKLDRCCGLATYLPAYPDYRRDSWHGTEFLDGFYKSNISWNDATGLVE